MRMAGKERRLVIAEVRQPVGGEFASAQRLDQARDLARAARHERALQRGHAAAVQDARGDAHDVFGCRTDLRTDDVVAVVKTDEVALEVIRELFFEVGIVPVHDHTVGDACRKILDVPGADPYGDAFPGDARIDEDLREALARIRLDALHAQHEDLVGHVCSRLDLFDKAAQPLRTDGDDDDLRPLNRCGEVAGEGDGWIQRHILVFAGIFEDLVRVIPFRAPGEDFLPLFGREIPGDERTPAPAAENGNAIHEMTSFDVDASAAADRSCKNGAQRRGNRASRSALSAAAKYAPTRARTELSHAPSAPDRRTKAVSS